MRCLSQPETSNSWFLFARLAVSNWASDRCVCCRKASALKADGFSPINRRMCGDLIKLLSQRETRCQRGGCGTRKPEWTREPLGRISRHIIVKNDVMWIYTIYSETHKPATQGSRHSFQVNKSKRQHAAVVSTPSDVDDFPKKQSRKEKKRQRFGPLRPPIHLFGWKFMCFQRRIPKYCRHLSDLKQIKERPLFGGIFEAEPASSPEGKL